MCFVPLKPLRTETICILLCSAHSNSLPPDSTEPFSTTHMPPLCRKHTHISISGENISTSLETTLSSATCPECPLGMRSQLKEIENKKKQTFHRHVYSLSDPSGHIFLSYTLYDWLRRTGQLTPISCCLSSTDISNSLWSVSESRSRENTDYIVLNEHMHNEK